MRVFGGLLVALLLAGCTFGGSSPREEPGPAAGTPGAVPAAGTPATSSALGGLPREPCLALTLTPHPEVFAVGQRVSLVATVSNCGGVEYVLLKPGRCTLARSLAVGIEEGNRTYWRVDREGPPVDEETFVGSHGPCAVDDATEAVLRPLGRWGMEFGFNGTVLRAVREVNETPAWRSVRTWTEPAKLAPGWHRVFLHLHAMDGSREWTLNRSVYVASTRDNPDPDVAPRPGMALWLPTPPPADAPRRPDGHEEFARRNAEQGPPEAPEVVLEAGRRLLREWTGACAANYTLTHVMHQSMEPFCSNGFDRCDRWGWMDYYILQFEVRFAVEGNASFALSFPVPSDGVGWTRTCGACRIACATRASAP